MNAFLNELVPTHICNALFRRWRLTVVLAKVSLTCCLLHFSYCMTRIKSIIPGTAWHSILCPDWAERRQKLFKKVTALHLDCKGLDSIRWESSSIQPRSLSRSYLFHVLFPVCPGCEDAVMWLCTESLPHSQYHHTEIRCLSFILFFFRLISLNLSLGLYSLHGKWWLPLFQCSLCVCNPPVDWSQLECNVLFHVLNSMFFFLLLFFFNWGQHSFLILPTSEPSAFTFVMLNALWSGILYQRQPSHTMYVHCFVSWW